MYIKRAIEQHVKQSEKTFKAVLITGARQTGKSTLLKHLFPQTKYVSIDDPFIVEQANENPNMFMMLNPPPIIYDEVQRTPDLFRYIKLKCDESEKKGQFLLSGSQPLELMESAAESLSGRVCVIELSGLSLREISGDPYAKPFVPNMEYIKERSKSAKPLSDIWTKIHRGSYPQLQDESIAWDAFYGSYVKTYLERDVRQLSAVQDLNDFRKFMVAVAARTGQMLNLTNIADEISKSLPTVSRWISILESSGIIYLLEPYTNSVLKRATKTPKLYFRDTGLAAYLTRWLTPETLANGAMSGAFFETFVISEILKSFANCGIDYRYCVSYYRGRDKVKVHKDGTMYEKESEIDLIIEQDGILYPIEIKKGVNISADQTAAFTVLDKIPEKKRGMGAVVCQCPQPGLLRENILQVPLWYI